MTTPLGVVNCREAMTLHLAGINTDVVQTSGGRVVSLDMGPRFRRRTDDCGTSRMKVGVRAFWALWQRPV